jgi:hypothetical protein
MFIQVYNIITGGLKGRQRKTKRGILENSVQVKESLAGVDFIFPLSTNLWIYTHEFVGYIFFDTLIFMWFMDTSKTTAEGVITNYSINV